MDSNRTLAFQIPNRHRYAVLRWYAQQHMDMVRHRIALLHFYAFLSAQIPQYLSNPTPKLPIHHFLPVLRQNDYMILAFPSYMCLTLSIFHYGPPWPLGPSSLEDRLSYLPLQRQSLFNSHRQSRWIIYDLGTCGAGLPAKLSETREPRNIANGAMSCSALALSNAAI